MEETAGPPPSLPRASAAEQLSVFATVLVPTLLRGPILRRPFWEAAATALDTDGRAGRVLRRIRAAHGPGPVQINVLGRRGALLLDPDQVRRVLEESPEPFTPANREKEGALAHFQPHGLLVTRGEARPARRHFNEAVLGTGERVHALAASFLDAAREEVEVLDHALGEDRELTWPRFAPSCWNAVRRVVFGASAREDRYTTDLLRRLRADANWLFLRPRRSRTRAEFEERVNEYLDRAEPGSLAAEIARTPVPPGTDPAGQVPHWLFAFDAAVITAFRTLALVAAHPEQAALVRAELAAHDASDPGAVAGLERLRAAVMETVRLWPTTLAILRDSTAETAWDGATVPGGTAFVVFSAFFHRDPDRLPHADRFAPEAWLEGSAPEDWSVVPFSGGPARCAGEDLVLFTITALLAALLERREFRLVAPGGMGPDRPLPHMLDHFALRLAGSPV